MDIPHIGGYLKALRHENNKTLKDVADAINASASYISQLEKGVRNPSDGTLQDILMKAFNLRDNDADAMIRKWRIFQYESLNEKGLAVSGENAQEGAEKKKETPAKKEIPMLPYYKEIPPNFSYALGDEYWPFFVVDPEVAKQLFIWQMKDDSMEPHIPEKAILILNRDTSNLPYRSLVLIRSEGRSTVRYFEKREDKFKLIPANNRYPVYFGDNVEVIGRVEKMLVNI